MKPDLILSRERTMIIGGRMDAHRRELVPLDEQAVEALADVLQSAKIEAVALCLLHAYANPAQTAVERASGRKASRPGDFAQSLSP